MNRTVSAGVIAPISTLAASTGMLITPAAFAQTPSLTLVGFPSPWTSSQLYGLSSDGRSASGNLGGGGSPGFLWTVDGGRNEFGRNGGPGTNYGFGISGDGTTVVGGAGNGAFYRAYRWSQSGGYHDLGVIPGYTESEAHDANHDGSIIVGTLSNGPGSSNQAFRWTATGGMQGLGAGTAAEAISGDGNVIVGDFGTATQAFRWTQSNGIQFLPSLGGTGPSSIRGVNYDGSIIVGNSGTHVGTTMWINGTPTELFSTIPNSVFTPYGVSDTGAVAAGLIQPVVGSLEAGVWTAATGTVRLADYLTANGVAIPPGLVLGTCRAVSADGLTFAGTTNNGPFGIQGFVARLPTPCPADLDNGSGSGMRDHAVTIDDLLYFLAAFESGNLAADLDNGSNNGTHDGAVTVEDLLYFLAHFEAGC